MTIQRFASTALFAEDIRQETNGQYTIVGVLPDNIEIESQSPPIAAVMPKLSVYVRTMIDLNEYDGSSVVCTFRAPGGQPIFEIEAASETLLPEAQKGRAQGATYMTVLHQAVLSPFPISELGRFKVECSYRDQTVLAGVVNILPAPPKTA